MTRSREGQLRERLQRAEAVLEALQSEQVDAVVGRKGVSVLRLKEVEQQLREAYTALEVRLEERTDEARRRAEQLQALALELTQAEEGERRRLAALLHDGLQQQLVAIRFHIDILGKRLAGDESCRSLIAKLIELADESIRSSRSLSQELSPPVLYHEGLTTALEWLARATEEKHRLRVEIEAAGEADPEDERLKLFLFQAAREMLFNVVKHAGVDRARLSLRHLDGELELAVEDEGSGFDPAVLDESTGTCSGFGLLSIRERAELLGARVRIDSAPGDGTRISLRWPEPAPHTEAASDKDQGPPEAVEEPVRRPSSTEDRGLRLLLVDDHQVIRHGLESLLDSEDDVTVVGHAATGAEAIAAALRLRPDVVIMDVAMPELDGVEATRRITAQDPSVRVIGLSMFDNGDVRRRMIEAGAEAYLTKSGPSEELLDAIRGRAPQGVDE